MLDALLDWSSLASHGIDVVVYLVMAAVGTLFFLIRLGINALMGSDGPGADLEFDTGGNSDANFGVFSLLSILAFFMGTGWMGLACRLDWNLSQITSAFISSGFGFVMMMGASGLAYATRRLNKEVRYDVSTTVGRLGRVYLTVPERGGGQGEVEVSVSGRRMILPASSTGSAIPAFTEVRIVKAKDDETLVVEPTGD